MEKDKEKDKEKEVIKTESATNIEFEDLGDPEESKEENI